MYRAALNETGKPELAVRYDIHQRGTFSIDQCADGHLNAIPRSCGARLCHFCRWQTNKRWVKSLTDDIRSPGYMSLIAAPLAAKYEEIKVILKGLVLAERARSVHDLRPVRDELALVAVVIADDEDAVNRIVNGMQDSGVIKGCEVQYFELNEIGLVLEQEMPALADFRDRPALLRKYLGIEFGHKVTRPRCSDIQRQADAENDVVISTARENGDSELDVNEAQDTASQIDFEEPIPEEFLHGVPDSWISSTLDPSRASVEGVDCRVCGKDTVRQGLYALTKGKLLRFAGYGPDTLKPTLVFDPTGELAVRGFPMGSRRYWAERDDPLDPDLLLRDSGL